MSAMAVAIFRQGSTAIRRDQEPWGQAFTFSVVVHAALLAIFLVNSASKPPAPAAILSEVNFVEKPAPPAPPAEVAGPAAEAPVKGAPDMTAASPVANPDSHVVAFAAPNPARGAEPVAAPIINAPIAPAGQMGAIGMKRGALAALPSDRAIAPARRGPMAMPGAGGGDRARGNTLALNTQGVDDVRRGGGGLGIPLTTEGGLTSGGGRVGPGRGGVAGVAGADGVLTEKKKAPVESLSASLLNKEAFGNGKGPFSLEGPLKYRKIKSMRMPPYPRWAEEKGIEASVSFRITVDAKGMVKDNMYLEKTSGYSELDTSAKEALLKFVFVPIPSDQPPEDEWGVATFKFELKK
jgi:TonB family protein